MGEIIGGYLAAWLLGKSVQTVLAKFTSLAPGRVLSLSTVVAVVLCCTVAFLNLGAASYLVYPFGCIPLWFFDDHR